MSWDKRSEVKEKMEEIDALMLLKKQFNKENFKKEITAEKAFDAFVLTFLSIVIFSVIILMSVVVFDVDIFYLKENISHYLGIYGALVIFAFSFLTSCVFMVFYTSYYHLNTLHNKKIIENYNFIFHKGENDINKCKFILNELISQRKLDIVNDDEMIKEIKEMLEQDMCEFSLNTSLAKKLIRKHQRLNSKNKDNGKDNDRFRLKIVENFV